MWCGRNLWREQAKDFVLLSSAWISSCAVLRPLQWMVIVKRPDSGELLANAEWTCHAWCLVQPHLLDHSQLSSNECQEVFCCSEVLCSFIQVSNTFSEIPVKKVINESIADIIIMEICFRHFGGGICEIKNSFSSGEPSKTEETLRNCSPEN